MLPGDTAKVQLFLSTPSARRATLAQPKSRHLMKISIHALREEGDFRMLLNSALISLFLSTPSARRATHSGTRRPSLNAFLSTPSARRATPCFFCFVKRFLISIHALREEGDKWAKEHPPREFWISIHALREEGDPSAFLFVDGIEGFLSTPSARRATTRGRSSRRPGSNFYPRPPRGGRRTVTAKSWRVSYFYPRPPRGGRRFTARAQPDFQDFYPRPPRGGRLG